MHQELEYRGVRTLISTERDGLRRWSIHPNGSAPDGATSGFARSENARGSFKEAVMAARRAVDVWLADGCAEATAAPVGEASAP